MQRPKLAPHKVDHGVTDGSEHPAHDAVATGVQFNLHHALAAAELADNTGLIGDDWAVVEVDSGHQLAHRAGADLTGHFGNISLRHAERRMGEHVGKLAVVGQQEQPAGLGVEPADVEQALLIPGRPPVEVVPAVLVRERTHDADGLVEHEVPLRHVELDGRTVDRHVVGRCIHAPAEFGDDLAIDLHPSGADQVFGDPSTGDTRRSHHLLQAFAFVASGDHRIRPFHHQAGGKSGATHQSN